MRKKANNRYGNEFFLTLSTPEMIKFCKNPPTDCEFMELREAAEILATRYEHCMRDLARF